MMSWLMKVRAGDSVGNRPLGKTFGIMTPTVVSAVPTKLSEW